MASVRARDPNQRSVMTNRAFFDSLCTLTRAGLMVMEKIVLVGRVVPPDHPDFRSELYETVKEVLDSLTSETDRPFTPYVWGKE